MRLLHCVRNDSCYSLAVGALKEMPLGCQVVSNSELPGKGLTLNRIFEHHKMRSMLTIGHAQNGNDGTQAML